MHPRIYRGRQADLQYLRKQNCPIQPREWSHSYTEKYEEHSEQPGMFESLWWFLKINYPMCDAVRRDDTKISTSTIPCACYLTVAGYLMWLSDVLRWFWSLWRRLDTTPYEAFFDHRRLNIVV